MAPAIVHFLCGAALFLFIAAPFALRYRSDRRWELWLVLAGGVWGLVPDVHHISPVYQKRVHAIHDSPVVDIFAFHYTLDRPAIRALYIESIFVSILLFLLAVCVFSLAVYVRDRLRPPETVSERALVVVGSGTIAAGYAVVATSVVFLHTGQLDVLATLAGFDGRDGILQHLFGWLTLASFGVAAGILFGAAFELVAPSQHVTGVIAGTTVGAVFAVLSWVGLTVLFAHLSDDVAGVGALWIHWPSLAGVVVFGVTCGLFYALLRGAFEHDISSFGITP